MSRYSIQATVNYPETETNISASLGVTSYTFSRWVEQLLDTEPEATSFVITISRTQEQSDAR